ncbi:DNA-directed RNA polymerase subunit alpha [bacterium]|nr:DNA-directed RNA polymerase subunit alpha [bacterium]
MDFAEAYDQIIGSKAQVFDLLKMDKEFDESLNRGRFTIEPLPRGFGVTVGNALRRVLLSSIQGWAISQIRIDGVEHEFATIDGILEDTVEILHNIRQVRCRINGAVQSTLIIDIQGESVVTAADFADNPDVEILDPEDYYICTITDPNRSLHIEAAVTAGIGFVPAIELKSKDAAIGVLTFDSNYSPVRQVSYSWENTRVGSATNYERLILTLEADGTKTPDRILTEAAVELRKYFDWISRHQIEEEVAEERRKEQSIEYQRNISKTIDDLGLSRRAKNCLDVANITTVGELIEYTPEQLLTLKSFGEKSLIEIVNKLAEMDLYLREETE